MSNLMSNVSRIGWRAVLILFLGIACFIFISRIDAASSSTAILAFAALFAGMLFFVWPDKIDILLFCVCAFSTIDARLRFSHDIHVGGAEFALAVNDVPLLVLLPILLFRLAVQKRTRVIIDFVTIQFALLLMVSFLSAFQAADKSLALIEFARMLKFFLFFVALRIYLNDSGNFKPIIYGFAFGALLQCVTVALQLSGLIALGDQSIDGGAAIFENEEISRAAGLMGHPNMLAQIVNLLAPLMLGVAVFAGSGRKLITAFLIYMLLIFSLLATLSRTGIAAFFGALLVFAVILVVQSEGFRKRLAKKILIFLIVVLVVAVAAMFNLLLDRFMNAPETNATSRINLLLIAANMIYENPWIGVGVNNFTVVMSQYDTTGISRWFPYPVHNIFALYAAEGGVISGILLFLIFTSNIAAGWKLARKRTDRISVFGVSLICCTLVVMVSGLTGWSFKADTIQLTYWTISAMVLSMASRSKMTAFQRNPI